MRMCKFTFDDGTVKKMTSDEADNLTMENGIFKEFNGKRITKAEFSEEYDK